MVMILIFHRSKTGFKGSTDLLNRLIMFTLNTFVLLKMSSYHLSHDFFLISRGTPTTVCAILCVITVNVCVVASDLSQPTLTLASAFT